jgi:hypothetical protein
MLNKPNFIGRLTKDIGYVIGNHKKELMLGMVLLILFAKTILAAVYNSMNVQSDIGVEPV